MVDAARCRASSSRLRLSLVRIRRIRTRAEYATLPRKKIEACVNQEGEDARLGGGHAVGERYRPRRATHPVPSGGGSDLASGPRYAERVLLWVRAKFDSTARDARPITAVPNAVTANFMYLFVPGALKDDDDFREQLLRYAATAPLLTRTIRMEPRFERYVDWAMRPEPRRSPKRRPTVERTNSPRRSRREPSAFLAGPFRGANEDAESEEDDMERLRGRRRRRRRRGRCRLCRGRV